MNGKTRLDLKPGEFKNTGMDLSLVFWKALV